MGEALVVGLIATETAVIVKGIADLATGNDTAAEDEADYDKIGGSTMTIAITGAMMLLGEIAAKLAKSIWDAVGGIFKGEKAPEVRVEAEPGKPVDTPEAKGELPEMVDGEKVVAQEHTPDGHDVKITRRAAVSSARPVKKSRSATKRNSRARARRSNRFAGILDTAKGLPNGDAKAQAIEQIKERAG